ncbi:cell division protein FtsZ [Flammeovirgaceae bacterium SG7u.111]|nr:cell division protein FtsZ [Flammeovirgaceae bacterium SG7u.132]WPO33813.1 cell division protein FtsZ [Flammeovirgaceae bacterium SG7u.111]
MEEMKYEFASRTNTEDAIIKVFGVGGGGGNAVNHMYRQGIQGVDFYICNTDIQALDNSPIPESQRIQIGGKLTEGLGAGAKPEVGKNAAVESKEEIKEVLKKGTKMLFITAGMGGGTGTGAAPVIAEVAKELDILTVAIVTRPFSFEGKPKARRAEEGIEELKKYCDTVLVILNNKLQEVYGKVTMKEAFGQADNVLTRGAKSIAEIITVAGNINVDFEDVKTVMKNSGAAVMGSATTEGENRARRAAEGAITSPLLNNTNIFGAKFILLSIVVGDEDNFQMDELEEITDYIQEQAGDDAEIIFGQATDQSLGDSINVTIIATGFDDEEKSTETKVYDLESNKIQKKIRLESEDFFDREEEDDDIETLLQKKKNAEKIVFELDGDFELIEETEEQKKKRLEHQYKMRQEKLEGLQSIEDMSNDEVKKRQETPAYMRRGVKLSNLPHSAEPNVSRYSLGENDEILGNNKFLHDNVD